MERNNVLIAQSGGPTAAVNATLAGAVQRSLELPEIGAVYGARNGVEGLLRGDLVRLDRRLRTPEDFARLTATPAMVLGSCRVRLSAAPDADYDALLELFRTNGIGCFFYIGGNDSMDTVAKLSDFFAARGEDIRVVGIPKTIDNDLALTDHTPGFGSAARYIATTVAEVFTDSEIYTPVSMTVVEIMGRNAGWLTASAALARRPGCPAPHLICMPEVPFDVDRFLSRVEEVSRTHRHLIVAVSEGIRRADGSYVASDDRLDPFGHRQLSGVGHRLGNLLKNEFGCKVRAIELNVLQRAAAHIQSETDITEAQAIGRAAVDLAVAGQTGVMAVFRRVSQQPYRVVFEGADIHRIANIERTVPVEWIDPDRFDIRQPLLDYLQPLIQNPSQPEPGVPLHFVI